MTSRRYLITGGAGFLGINLCRYLLERGCYVRTLDIAPFAYPERARIDVIDGDVRDAAAVERAVAGVDIVVHGAAALPLAPAEEILSTGIHGTRCVLEQAERAQVERVIFTSSTAVYGVPETTPIREDAPLRPINPYGETKRTFEGALRWYGEAYGLRSVSLQVGARGRSLTEH